MRNQSRAALACAFGMVVASPTWAENPFTMTFEGIPPIASDTFGSSVLGFYNDDPQREGSRPWNTTFTANALAICVGDGNGCSGIAPESPRGGSYVGNVVNEPIEFTLTNQYLSNLSFFYYLAAQNAKASVELFSGGSRVGTIQLPGCEGNCNWRQYEGLDEPLDGGDEVTRVRFLSTANSAVFDDISVTTTGGTSIPEPSTYALMVTGLVLLAGVRRRSARATR